MRFSYNGNVFVGLEAEQAGWLQVNAMNHSNAAMSCVHGKTEDRISFQCGCFSGAEMQKKAEVPMDELVLLFVFAALLVSAGVAEILMSFFGENTCQLHLQIPAS